jgi:small subunit ribosomal protein S3
MGQKTHPKGFRLVVDRDWRSRYFASKKDFPAYIRADRIIRDYITQHLRFAAVSKVDIERAGSRLRVTIHSGRRGVIIGRKGQELDKLRDKLKQAINKTNLPSAPALDLILEIQEVTKPEVDAQLVAENIALQIEKRAHFRRLLKKAVQTAMSLGVKGIRVQCSGRLGGAEIARTEKQKDGSASLQTLRQPIDYGFFEARTIYGLIGVKCWIAHKSKS